MPKASRRRSVGHEQSVRVASRRFAAQDATEHVEVGDEIEKPAIEILESMAEDSASNKQPLKKKEKQAMKHELFMQSTASRLSEINSIASSHDRIGLESTRQPYSKSHERRLKRKAREQVAGGLEEIQAAIAEVAGDEPDTQGEGEDGGSKGKSRPKTNAGMIGEGKSAPLSKQQRKRALQTEKLRIPLILSNPAFASNPFQTIRTHAQNTLVKHQQGE
ncbi:hypothetical protein NLI96_g10629 [Meripilus lineatus]|uniref:Ribosome biogenesis protein SLX9 n=1 Tax=Meripilus lineatus TaxID=2056292 RepID=A0AAD5UYD2_9APHY|nr:hypothetical protein NLI96_g10629 [Physisporinus lineatus]